MCTSDRQDLYDDMLKTVSTGTSWRRRIRMPTTRLVVRDRARGCSQAVREEVWHEVQAKRYVDPVTNNPAVVFTQTDVSETMKAESKVAAMRQKEGELLREMLPPHVLDVMLDARREARQYGRVESSSGSEDDATLTLRHMESLMRARY